MYAAAQEEKLRSRLSWPEAKEIKEKTVILRWADDLLVVADRGVSRRASRYLKRLTRVSAYGKGLKLVETFGGEAFGFKWAQEQGLLVTEQSARGMVDETSLAEKQESELYGPGQFDTRQ